MNDLEKSVSYLKNSTSQTGSLIKTLLPEMILSGNILSISAPFLQEGERILISAKVYNSQPDISYRIAHDIELLSSALPQNLSFESQGNPKQKKYRVLLEGF